MRGGTRRRGSVVTAAADRRASASAVVDDEGETKEEDGGRQQTTAAEALALRLGQSRVQLGLNLPAKRLPGRSSSQEKGQEREEAMEDVVLYFGIIDILQVGCRIFIVMRMPFLTGALHALTQNFNPAKRLEHHVKAIVHDSHSISVTDPKAYATRFKAFMNRVFV